MTTTTLSIVPKVATGPQPTNIADINRIMPLHPFLRMTEKPKNAYGYKEKKMFPRVTEPVGSMYYTNVGVNRAQGACKWGIANRYQAPMFRDPSIRLRYPHLERDESARITEPQRTFGEYSQRFSSAIVL
jgi:hypothetical protein